MAGDKEEWRDFVERDEDKGALSEARMGNLKIGLVEDEVVVEQHVEVEGAGAVGEARSSIAAKVVFDDEQRGEQRAWGERSFELDDSVDEARLAGKADWFGGVERRLAHDAAERVETRGSGSESGLDRTGGTGEVAAHGDEGSAHTVQGIAGR